MAIAIFRINYKSDFILTLNSDAGWMTPFCIKFWTGAPSQAYFVGFDGTTYTHCAPVEGDPTKLSVQFDDHHLPIGDLKFQIGYHFTVEDFPTSVEDEVLNQASVIIEQDGEPAQVMLDFNGETAPEIEFSLPAYANEAQRIANEEQRIENEQARISAENERISNEDARIAEEQVRVSQEAARVSEFAQLKEESQEVTADANASAQLANEKAAEAQQKAVYAQTQGDYAKAQGDIAQADHTRAESDHTTATADHTQAAADHAQAAADHTRADSDHTRAESDHEAVELYVDSLGAFDISAYHATGGVLAKYADLAAALGTDGANIPYAIRKGGMSVKFVLSSDNKYVQYFLTKDEWSASEADWEKLNLEEEVSQLGQEFNKDDTALRGDSFPFIDDHYYRSLDNKIIANAGFSYCKVEKCKAGDRFKITANNQGSASALLYVEVPDDGSANVESSITRMTDEVYTITKDCTFYVNTFTSVQHSVFYLLGALVELNAEILENNCISSIYADAFGYSNFQYNAAGLLIYATIKWFDGTTGTMTITYSGNNISYIDYTYGSATYRQTIDYTNGEITVNQVVKL